MAEVKTSGVDFGVRTYTRGGKKYEEMVQIVVSDGRTRRENKWSRNP